MPVPGHPAQGCTSPFAAPGALRELHGCGAVSQLRLVVGPRHGPGSAELRAALRAHTHGTMRFEAPLPLVRAPREAGAGPCSQAEFCSTSRHRWLHSGVCLRAPNICLSAARSDHSNKLGMLQNSSLVPCKTRAAAFGGHPVLVAGQGCAVSRDRWSQVTFWGLQQLWRPNISTSTKSERNESILLIGI